MRIFLLNLSGFLLIYFINFLSVGEDVLEYGGSMFLLLTAVEKFQ